MMQGIDRFLLANCAKKRGKDKWEDLKVTGEETLRNPLLLISPQQKHKQSLEELEASGVKKETIITASFTLSPNLTRLT